MRKILFIALFSLAGLSNMAYSINLDTKTATSNLTIDNAASISGLNNIQMTLLSGQPSQPNAVYEGHDVFEVDTNVDLSLSVSATPLKHSNCTDTSNPLVNCPASEIIELTTNTLSHQNVYVGITSVTLTSTATLGPKISDQKAGDYSSVITITAAPQ